MTEFSSEFIQKEKKIFENAITKPKQLAGVDDTVIVGVYGYDEEVGYYDYSKFAECGNKDDAEFIFHACLNYPRALDHIELLQQRIAELEHYKKLNEQWVKEKIDGLTTLEEIEKMVMIVERINKSNASVRCGWCGAEFETRDEVKEHAYGCKDNPLNKYIKRYENLITNLFVFLEKDKLVRAHANEMSEFIKEYRDIKADLPQPPKEGE